MELQNFESDYLFNKDLSYFEDFNTAQKSMGHIYVADNVCEIQETLEELNLSSAMLYNLETDSFERQVIFS